MSDLRAAVERLPGYGLVPEKVRTAGPDDGTIHRAAVLALIPEGAVLVTQETLAEAAHAVDAGGICPRTDCDYHWTMAAAILRHLREGT